MPRSRRFFGGLRLAYLYQALVMVTGLWITPFLLKHLGQHDYGLWLVGLQTLSYLVLMDFGIVAILPRTAAYATGHAISGKSHDLPEIIGRTARVVLYQTPIVAAAGAILWFLVPMGPAIRGPILVTVLGFALLFPFRIFQAVLHGLQELPYLGKLQFASWAISTVLMVILILRGVGLYALAIGWVAGQLIPSILSMYHLKTAFPHFFPTKLPKMDRKELFRSMTSGTWVSVAQISQVLMNGSDYIIIGKLLGPSAVVPYACTQKLIMVLANQPIMIMEMAAPGLSQMKTSESRARIFQACNALTLGLLSASGAVACVTLAVNHSFVSWWLGESQFAGSAVTIAFVAAMLLRHWNNTSMYTIFAFGHERRMALTTLGDGIVTLVTGVVLVHWFGIIGAPLGAMLGSCLVSLPGTLSALAGELRVSVFAVASSIWSWFWRFAIAAAFAVVMGQWWHANLPYIVGMSCLAGGLYAAIILPMIMESSLRNYLPPEITRLWDALRGRFRPNSAPPVAPRLEEPVEAPKNL